MAPTSSHLNRLAHRRLRGQCIAQPTAKSPGEVVRHLGAMQAQDYHASLWAVGLRTPTATQADIEQAVAAGDIVRTWPMRGTLHWVAAADVRWMLELAASRTIALNAARIEREHGLDARTLSQCRKVVTRALSDGHPRTRAALYETLERAGHGGPAQRSLNILGRLAQEGLICQGPRIGKQPSFVLLDAWVPQANGLSRDQALGELALRYFRGHGPATVHDLAWWSGLTLKDAQAGLALARSSLQQETIGDAVHWFDPDADVGVAKPAGTHLLPAFDEYLIGYKDRSAAFDAAHTRQVVGINGLVSPCVVVDGRVAALWKRNLDKQGAALTIAPLRPLKKSEHATIAPAAQRFARFIDLPVRVEP